MTVRWQREQGSRRLLPHSVIYRLEILDAKEYVECQLFRKLQARYLHFSTSPIHEVWTVL